MKSYKSIALIIVTAFYSSMGFAADPAYKCIHWEQDIFGNITREIYAYTNNACPPLPHHGNPWDPPTVHSSGAQNSMFQRRMFDGNGSHNINVLITEPECIVIKLPVEN